MENIPGAPIIEVPVPKKPKKKQIGLYVLLALCLFAAYRMYVPNHMHRNPKYHFKFRLPDGVQVESTGNILTCGRNNCAKFAGNPNFDYSAHEDPGVELFGGQTKTDIAYIGRTEIGTDGTVLTSEPYWYYYVFKYDNGKVRKAFSNVSEDPIASNDPYQFSKEEVRANREMQDLHNEVEIQPWYTNKYGVDFYKVNEDGSQYCTFKPKEENKFLTVCFTPGHDPYETDDSIADASARLANTLQPIFDTFRFTK